MKPLAEWSPQALAVWEKHTLTTNEMLQVEIISLKLMNYRERHSFIASPCWMDEWAYGYFCALRDTKLITPAQWGLLCDMFKTEGP